MNEHVNPRGSVGGNSPPLADQLAISEAGLVAEVEAIADRANVLPRSIAPATADADMAVIGEVIKDANELVRRLEKRRADVKDPWLKGGQTVDTFFKTVSTRVTRVSVAFTKLVADYREEQRQHQARIAAEVERKRRAEEQERLRAALEADRKGRANTAALERDRAEQAAREADEAQAQAQTAAALAPTPTKAEVGGVTMTTKAEWTHDVVDARKIDLEALRPYLKGEHIELAIKAAVRFGVREIGGVRIFQREQVSFR